MSDFMPEKVGTREASGFMAKPYRSSWDPLPTQGPGSYLEKAIKALSQEILELKATLATVTAERDELRVRMNGLEK